MQRTRIKICGVMRQEDALLAAELGADYVGFICHAPAKRYVPIEIAEGIVASLPAGVTPVAVFVDESASVIERVVGELGVETIQLNGSQPPETVRALGSRRVIKAIAMDADRVREELRVWREAVAEGLSNLIAIVLETAKTGVAGGSGKENDWALVEQLLRENAFDGLPAIIAAGGLHPGNVRSVVERTLPFAVDVSSGVEEISGNKSREKIEQFIAETRAAKI